MEAPGSTTPTRRGLRYWPLISAAAAFLLAALLTLAVVYREADKPFGFEVEWMSELLEHRSQPWTAIALIFDHLGGGIIAIVVVPVALIAALLLARRRWAALFFAISALACVGVTQLLKRVIGRPRPVEILVSADPGSFPSGHSANAAVTATVLALVYPRLRVWVAGAAYTAAMMLSRTYLGAHWISDTVGGLLLGIGLAVILYAPLAVRLRTEAAAIRSNPRTPLSALVRGRPAPPDKATESAD